MLLIQHHSGTDNDHIFIVLPTTLLHDSFLHTVLDQAIFEHIHMYSQGSVAAHLRCRRMFCNDFVTNLLLSLSLAERILKIN